MNALLRNIRAAAAAGSVCCALKYYIARRGSLSFGGKRKQKYDSFFVHFRHIIVVTLGTFLYIFFFPTYENNVLMRVFHLYKLFDLRQAWAPSHLAHLSRSHGARGFVIILLLYI
jgi:hypothetical protein